jgi:phosphatidylinositol 3,5-bisphosphate 5-phosphatase
MEEETKIFYGNELD